MPLLQLHAKKGDWRVGLHQLAKLLRGAGATVQCVLHKGEAKADRATACRLKLETLLFRSGQHAWISAPPSPEDHALSRHENPVLIGLSAGLGRMDLQLTLDGEPGIASLARKLAEGRIPLIAWHTRAGALASSGLPAIERFDRLALALEDAFARIATTLLIALDAQHAGRANLNPWPLPAGKAQDPRLRLAATLGRKAFQRLAPSRLRADHWRVAIRPREAGLDFLARADFTGFRWLPDDGERYFADPILWEHEGRTYLLVEEYPYSTQRGRLCYTELGHDGAPLFPPRLFLERAGHLSYPFVFSHQGEIYLCPENATEGDLPLYRARRFPDVWEELPPLILGLHLHDATLIAHAGRFFILANDERQGGSPWDCLSVFVADHPLGPYRPHWANPVLVDVRYARSAGPILNEGGRLLRPVQNCAAGYGAALAFAEITRLDDQGYDQRILHDIAPKRASGLHTYARSSRFEAIDLLTPREWRHPPG